MFQSPFCARQNGISIHCARHIKTTQRRELEQLISYATRPPLSEQRLKKRDDGLLEFTLKRTFIDGTRAIVLTPMALLGRLAAIIPSVWHNLTRFGGILAPNARDRAAVVPAPRIAYENPETSGRYGWAALLKRVFQIDLLRCAEGALYRPMLSTTPAPSSRLIAWVDGGRLLHARTDPPSSGGKSPRAAGNGELTYQPL